MPLVKIDYVVSFSSEDPENPASNLLLPDVKSKWLCNKGELSCSIVLQLKSACKIDTITIGAYHVALIEVLVGLSEKPNDPFQVLVPSCVLLSPAASRRGEAVEAVRSLGAAQLAAAAAARRWDRVRLVCSQPYNKHCKYGLAFVHVSSAETAAPAAPPATRGPLALDAGSSDEEFRPGELFAKHSAKKSTDAQIRQASSQALRNIDDSSTKLTKTPITKTAHAVRRGADEPDCDRLRPGLLYCAEDAAPHARIDRVLQRHGLRDSDPGARSENSGHPSRTNTKDKMNNKSENEDNCTTDKNNVSHKRSNGNNGDESNDARHRNKLKTLTERDDKPSNAGTPTVSQKKRKKSEETHPDLGPVCGALGDVLAGAVVALSGYVNPRRAALRDAALQLGAQYRRDWQPDCTHLVCAFANTPKLRAVRAARARTACVEGAWLEQCRARRRRLPWRWFAAEPAHREPVPPAFRDPPPAEHSEGDTDDEFEKVLQQQRKRTRVRSASPSPPRLDASRDSDVAFVRDERVQAHVTLRSDSDTEPDEPRAQPPAARLAQELPALWEGLSFAVSRRLPAAQRALLARYITAYGGLVLEESEALERGAVDYVVGEGGEAGAAGGAGGARRVSPAWVWRALAAP